MLRFIRQLIRANRRPRRVKPDPWSGAIVRDRPWYVARWSADVGKAYRR